MLERLREVEWAGTTSPWRGERQYLLAPLVGDAILPATMSAAGRDRRFLFSPESALVGHAAADMEQADE